MRLTGMVTFGSVIALSAGTVEAEPAGYVTGMNPWGAKCMDRTPPRATYYDWSTGLGDFDCSEPGMVLEPGEEFFVKIIGDVTEELPLGIEVTSGDPISAVGCKNLDTGQGLFHFLQPGEQGFFDCEISGPLAEPGETVLIQVQGQEAGP